MITNIVRFSQWCVAILNPRMELPRVCFGKNLNAIMAHNGVKNVNSKGFMTDIVQANWNVMRKNYRDGDHNDSKKSCEDTCLALGPPIWTRLCKNTSHQPCICNTNKFLWITRMPLEWRMLKLNTMASVRNVYLLDLPLKKVCWVFLSSWDYGTSIINNGMVICLR